jgi:hypothetical protein
MLQLGKPLFIKSKDMHVPCLAIIQTEKPATRVLALRLSEIILEFAFEWKICRAIFRSKAQGEQSAPRKEASGARAASLSGRVENLNGALT